MGTRESPTGSSYSGSGALSVLRNFQRKWRTDPELSAKSADMGVVHLISGMDLPSDPGVLGIAYVGSACEGAASAVMNPYNTCTTNFRSQSRAQIKDYVQFYAGSPGCLCAGSTEPDPISSPPPPPPSP